MAAGAPCRMRIINNTNGCGRKFSEKPKWKINGDTVHLPPVRKPRTYRGIEEIKSFVGGVLYGPWRKSFVLGAVCSYCRLY
jgi:hypothetical protein